MGSELHEDVRALFYWHDGSGGLANPLDILPAYCFMSANECLTYWQTKHRIFLSDIHSDHPDHSIWDTRWMPIATDYCGNLLVADHTHGPSSGRVFIVDKIDGALPFHTWPSVEALFGDFTAALYHEAPLLQRVAYASDRRLLWRRPL